MSERSLRPTWAWLWASLALVLLAAGAAIIATIALSGGDRDEVTLAVALIGFPALLGALALGVLSLVMARPTGRMWRMFRRWTLALVGAVALTGGFATLSAGSEGALLLIVAGVSALAFLWLDLRRGRDSAD